MRIQIEVVVGLAGIRQNKSQTTLLSGCRRLVNFLVCLVVLLLLLHSLIHLLLLSCLGLLLLFRLENRSSWDKSQWVCYKVSFDILVNFGQSLLNIAVWQLAVIVNVKRGICIDFHKPNLPIFINKNIHAEHLETTRILVVCTDKAMVSVLEVRLQSDDRFGSELIYLTPQIIDVATRLFSLELLVDVSK